MNAMLWKEPPNHFSISRSEIHVWYIDLNTLNEPKNSGSILSYEERKHMESLIFQCDRYRYQITHAIKRIILANYLSCDPKSLQFKIAKRGKPSLIKWQNFLNIQFNISHSHSIILIAITKEDPIGIDIECHNEKKTVEELGNFVFSPLEKAFFSSLSSTQEREKAFFRCWTRKEAYLKLKGIGLTSNLAEISVDMNELPLRDELIISTFEAEESIPCKFIPIDMESFYMTAVVATLFFEKYLYFFDTKCFFL